MVERGIRGARVVDPASKVGLRFELASSGAMSIQKTKDGVEDRVRIEDDRTSIEYVLDLEGDVRLRHVANVIELLDREGTPRLRITARELRDGRGVSHPLSTSLVGCRADTDPRPPWNRPTIDPGSSTCMLRVSWEAHLPLPLVIDPGWTTTNSMAFARSGHSMTSLLDGRVFIAGGVPSFGGAPEEGTEVFDPTTDTFATSSAMSIPRYGQIAERLANGTVLLSGGSSTNFATVTASEIWDPQTGLFSPAGPLAVPRVQATSLRVASGEILVTGGLDDGNNPLDSLEVFDPSTKKFTLHNGLIDAFTTEQPARYGSTMTALPNGDVLIAGGNNFYNTPEAHDFRAAKLYSNGAFVPTGSMNHPRYFAAAFTMPNGKVLVAGGYDPSTYQPTDTMELYDPSTKTFSDTTKLPLALSFSTHAVLQGLFVFAGGGSVDITKTAFVLSDTVQVYDPIANVFRTPIPLPMGVSGSPGAVLPPSPQHPDGALLVAGGSTTTTVLKTAGVIEIGGGGRACKDNAECLSQICDKNQRCCKDTMPCTGTCRSCSGVDGTCGFTPVSTDDDTCTGDDTCDGKGGCAKKNGRVCANATECASGNCVDGICCDLPCNDACGSCTLDARKGSCLPVPSGTRPKSECGRYGACNGKSIACTPPTCDTPNSSVSSDGQRIACDPYLCGSDGACRVECSTSNDCVSPSVCDRGKCVAPRFDVGAVGCNASGSSSNAWWIVLAIFFARRRRLRSLAFLGCLIPTIASAGNWEVVGSLQVARMRSSAVRLQNGNIWITGGCTDDQPFSYCVSNKIRNDSEIFDPVAKATSFGPTIGVARYGHTATLLATGQVLVVGGCESESREPYEGCQATQGNAVVCSVPLSCKSLTGASPRGFHTATLLQDGRVFIAGGFDQRGDSNGIPALSTTQIYDPSSEKFVLGPPLAKTRGAHTATLLSDGRVLLVGGVSKGQDSSTATALSSIEIFDPKTNLMDTSNLGAMKDSRVGFGAVKLPSGDVLVAGGRNASLQYLDSAEIFDPTTKLFTQLQATLTSSNDGVHGFFLSGLDRAILVSSFSNTFDHGTKTFLDLGSLSAVVMEAAYVDNGPFSVIVAGGRSNRAVPPTSIIQAFRLRSDGAPCDTDFDCTSRNCIDSVNGPTKVCCPKDCDGTCSKCVFNTGTCAPIANGDTHGACKDDRACDGTGSCKKVIGRACDKNEDCVSGICADHVCCETSCTAPCLACDRVPSGKCVPIAGLPAHGTCPANQACGGGSDGCVPSICDGDHTIRAGNATIDCSPYKCTVDGRCLDRCSSIQHCVAPYACTPDGICNKPVFDRGAGCATTDDDGGWMIAALAMIGLAAIRNRVARRRSE